MDLILDTNIFVAAAFNKRSSSYRILESIRSGNHTLVWDQATFSETKHILGKIPPIHWPDFEPLFTTVAEYHGKTGQEDFGYIKDPDDRKFAALAAATGATLISNDDHLLSHAHKHHFKLQTPSAFLASTTKPPSV